jgi:NAD(P)-dependent dehydrogenase (short-subunit alcohol dehydrogenase family)
MARQIIITGANGGIGTALCEAYHSRNFDVVAIDIQSMASHKFKSQYITLDQDEYVRSKEYRKKIDAQLSKLNPSVLINNAATQLLGEFSVLDDDDWTTTMNVNFQSCYFLIKACYEALAQNIGQVINIGSIHANQTKPRFFAYAASKSALVGLTKALAVELKGKITVNAVSPAAIGTDMLRAGFDNDDKMLSKLAGIHPSQEIGSPQLLANFITDITLANNRFLYGSNISYDGGISSALLDLDY